MNKLKKTVEWQQSKADIFWGEIAPCDHVVQIYENDGIFLDALAGFVGGGINAGDCCIIIATGNHIKALEKRLTGYGIQVHDLISENRYIPLNAEKTLSKFMVNNWPDETLFNKVISGVIAKCPPGRRIRAFGEMVAILWAQGHSGATVQLEHLWNRYCEKQSLCLYCAYPKSGFTEDMNESFRHICGSHSKMISGTEKQLTDISYRELVAV
ncbi:MAG: MEDS domain-containing protein [Chitinophagaceae bacterium]